MDDTYPRVRRQLTEPEVLRRLSRHNLPRWLVAVGVEWLIIGATFWVCFTWPYWWVWLVAIPVIGTRQHGLGILGHEGTHQLITRPRHRNDSLANWLTCYQLCFTVQGYRRTHLKHHWYLETPKDPSKVSVEDHPRDWTFPMAKWHFAGMLLRDLSGFSQASSSALLKYLWDVSNKGKHLAQMTALHVAAIGLFAALGFWWAYPILWLVPLFTVAVTCYRIRGVAEHSGFGDSRYRYKRDRVDALVTTRTSVLCPILAALFAPYNVSYHIEHHMYPSVPAFNLKKLHKELARNAVFVENAHVTRGYRGLFGELTALDEYA